MSDRWQQIVDRLAAVGCSDGGFRYDEPRPDVAVGSDPHQHRLTESAIWSELVEGAATGPDPGIALDAGCGTGVHLQPLAERFRHVLAIDADRARIAALQARWPVAGDRVRCFALPLQDAALRDPLLRGQFALVHCIQVLGHVATSDLSLILDTLGALLEDGGRLLLAVPFTNRDRDDFRVAALRDDGTVRGRASDPREFDRLLAAPEVGLLPVHHFALPTLMAGLRGVGLAIEAERPYNWFSYEHADLMLLARRAAAIY